MLEASLSVWEGSLWSWLGVAFVAVFFWRSMRRGG